MYLKSWIERRRLRILVAVSAWCIGWGGLYLVSAHLLTPDAVRDAAWYCIVASLSGFGAGLNVTRRLWARLPTASSVPSKYPDDLLTLIWIVLPVVIGHRLSALSPSEAAPVVLVATTNAFVLGLAVSLYWCARPRGGR